MSSSFGPKGLRIRSAVFFACAALGLSLGCDPEAVSSSNTCFVATFGSPPGSQVRNLQAYGNEGRDDAWYWLSFQCPPLELHRLIGKTFKNISAQRYQDKMRHNFTPPAWWKPCSNPPCVFMESSGFHGFNPTYSEGNAYISYDPSSKVAWVFWNGVF